MTKTAPICATTTQENTESTSNRSKPNVYVFTKLVFALYSCLDTQADNMFVESANASNKVIRLYAFKAEMRK